MCTRVLGLTFSLTTLLLMQGTTVLGQAGDHARVPRATVAEVRELLARDAVVLIDVREPADYEAGHIPGAISIPLDDLDARAPALRAEKRPIVLYCT